MDWASSVPTLLASVSVRAAIVAGAAGIVLRVARVRTEAARHAVWSVVAAGMLLSLTTAPLLPPIRLRVLSASPVPVAVVTAGAEPAMVAMGPTPEVRYRLSWRQVAVAVYGLGMAVSLLRLALAYGFTWRLVRRSRPVELLGDVYESRWIAVPMTVGWLRPKILLPPNWREWDRTKLDAVFAHERAHIERADWLTTGIAALNRSVFWFHPLAWWLERTLSRLSEQACDDAALRELGRREQYAQVLLDMAAEVKSWRGRVAWEAMAMAKATEVRVRIDRILDETRPIPGGWNRRRRAGLLAGGVPLFCVVSALQLAPARAIEQKSPAAQTPVVSPAPPEARTQSPSEAPRAPRDSKRKNAPAAQPKPVKTVAAEYPTAARAANVEGTVRLSIAVGKDGTVTDVTSASGHPLLIPAATEAVRKWAYGPQRAELRLQVEVPFHLDRSTPAQAPQIANSAAPAEESTSARPTAPASGSLAPRGSIEPARVIYKKPPEYPMMARQMGANGEVQLAVIVGTDGRVKGIRVLRGHPLLVKAAMDAVQQWIYRPTLLNGAPVQNEVRVTLSFVAQPAPQVQADPPTNDTFEQPLLLYHKAPETLGIAGTVHAIATVGKDGRLKNIRIEQGDPVVGRAAMEALKQWIYRPAILNGEPVEAETKVTLQFQGNQ
jgi:TonB family protein